MEASAAHDREVTRWLVMAWATGNGGLTVNGSSPRPHRRTGTQRQTPFPLHLASLSLSLIRAPLNLTGVAIAPNVFEVVIVDFDLSSV